MPILYSVLHSATESTLRQPPACHVTAFKLIDGIMHTRKLVCEDLIPRVVACFSDAIASRIPNYLILIPGYVALYCVVFSVAGSEVLK